MTDLISSEKLSESIFLTVIVLIVLCTGMLDRWGHWVTDGVWAYKECRMLFIFACIEVRDMYECNLILEWYDYGNSMNRITGAHARYSDCWFQ